MYLGSHLGSADETARESTSKFNESNTLLLKGLRCDLLIIKISLKGGSTYCVASEELMSEENQSFVRDHSNIT